MVKYLNIQNKNIYLRDVHLQTLKTLEIKKKQKKGAVKIERLPKCRANVHGRFYCVDQSNTFFFLSYFSM